MAVRSNLWGSYKRDDVPTALKAAKTKLALIFGARSALMHPEDALYVKGLMPKGSPCFGIPMPSITSWWISHWPLFRRLKACFAIGLSHASDLFSCL